MPVLEIRDIHKSFRHGFLGRSTPVLKGLSLSVNKGEVYGLLGHNGAGKTTTMKLILGLIRPESGTVSVFGAEGVTSQTRSRIGYLSEEIGLYPYFNAAEMLQMVGELFQLSHNQIRQRTAHLLETVGLSKKRRVKIRHYSKGMRQRLGIASALMNDPELLLLDEPYSGLDPVGRKELRELLLSLKTSGKTIMLSSHIVPDVEAVCDRVGILGDGRTSRVLDLHEVYSDRKNDVEVVISNVDRARLHASDYGGKEMFTDRSITIIQCRGDQTLRSLVADVYDAGGSVVGLRQVRLNLEEIFVEEVAKVTGAESKRPTISKDELVHSD